MVVEYLIVPLEDENKKLESLYASKEMPSSVKAELAFSFDNWISLDRSLHCLCPGAQAACSILVRTVCTKLLWEGWVRGESEEEQRMTFWHSMAGNNVWNIFWNLFEGFLFRDKFLITEFKLAVKFVLIAPQYQYLLQQLAYDKNSVFFQIWAVFRSVLSFGRTCPNFVLPPGKMSSLRGGHVLPNKKWELWSMG